MDTTDSSSRRPPKAAQQFNKLAVRLAGSPVMPVWAKVSHTGRVSGKTYETPVAVTPTADSFYIALPWGRGTDWVRNLQAAGGGTIRWRGTTYAVTKPTFVPRAEALAAARTVPRKMMERWKLDDYLRLTKTKA